MELGPDCPTQSVCLTKLKRSLPGGFIFCLPQQYHNAAQMSSPVNHISTMEVPPFIKVRDMQKYFATGLKKTLQLIANRKIKAKRDGKFYIIDVASVIKHLTGYTNIPKKEAANV